MTDQKFCFGCQKMRKASDGTTVRRNNRNRWMCSVCFAKSNESPYAKKSTRPQPEAP